MNRTYWPTAEWQAAAPETLGMDSNKLSNLDPLIESDYSNINGMVVVRAGSVAYERYYNGYGPDDPQHVASVTKSILSALIGIAIDKGYITSVDEKVLDFFPDYVPGASSSDSLRSDITIRHLLTMTAPYAFEDWREPLDKMCMQSDWVNYSLDMLGHKGTVGAFKYSTAGAHLLSAIITRSTGRTAREFANDYLFKPIGMREIPAYELHSFGFEELFGKEVRGWVTDPSGNSTGGWGLTLTPRDMARYGYLYLNHGQWDNKQIVPQAWIDESTAMNPNKYGYLWWLGEEDGVYLAMGDGGNVICCIPDQDMVVVIASSFMINPCDRWMLIKEWIMPAIKSES